MENEKTLDEYREQIDSIDAEIACLIAQRMALSDCIGSYKRQNGLPVRNKAREEQVVSQAVSGIGPAYADSVRIVYETIFSESRARQERVNGTPSEH